MTTDLSNRQFLRTVIKEQLRRWKNDASALRREINNAHVTSPTPQTIAEVARAPSRAERLYFDGISYERNKQWRSAAEKYRSALSFDDTRADWHARLGLVLEQDAQWEDAALAFEAALKRETLTRQ